MMTKHEHWALDEKEAEQMAKSVVAVARHYPKVASSQKLIDWAMLFGTIGMAYVPRVMMTREIIENTKKGKASAEMAVAA
jgi:hypothetical protein